MNADGQCLNCGADGRVCQKCEGKGEYLVETGSPTPSGDMDSYMQTCECRLRGEEDEHDKYE